MLRMLFKHRISTAYIPEVLVRMRTGGVSNASLKNRWRANREDRMAWRLNNLTPFPWTLVAKPLRKLSQWRRTP
jgi:glycosyltransferase